MVLWLASDKSASEWILIPKNASIITKAILIAIAKKKAEEILDTSWEWSWVELWSCQCSWFVFLREDIFVEWKIGFDYIRNPMKDNELFLISKTTPLHPLSSLTALSTVSLLLHSSNTQSSVVTSSLSQWLEGSIAHSCISEMWALQSCYPRTLDSLSGFLWWAYPR